MHLWSRKEKEIHLSLRRKARRGLLIAIRGDIKIERRKDEKERGGRKRGEIPPRQLQFAEKGYLGKEGQEEHECWSVRGGNPREKATPSTEIKRNQITSEREFNFYGS